MKILFSGETVVAVNIKLRFDQKQKKKKKSTVFGTALNTQIVYHRINLHYSFLVTFVFKNTVMQIWKKC